MFVEHDRASYRAAYQSHCELERYFPGGNERELILPYPPRNGYSLVPGRRLLRGTEVHHICGSGNGAQRVDTSSNMICVCNPVHCWLETYKIPGFVLACWAKLAKCELDWREMERIKGKLLPSWLETDEVRRQCQIFPWLETMRQQLVTHKQERVPATENT